VKNLSRWFREKTQSILKIEASAFEIGFTLCPPAFVSTEQGRLPQWLPS
jgi:hypothetical protein